VGRRGPRLERSRRTQARRARTSGAAWLTGRPPNAGR